MNTDTLDQATDAELNELFAVEVAGFIMHPTSSEPSMSRLDVPEKWCYRDRWDQFYIGDPYDCRNLGLEHKWGYMWHRPVFATDANTVLLWLEKHPTIEIYRVYQLGGNGLVDESLPLLWSVSIGGPSAAPTFARAACLALIRARRAGK